MPSETRRPLIRRYLVFLLIITAAVMGLEQLFQLVFLNTTGRAEARRALAAHPELAARIGNPRFGFAWRGHDTWWIPGPAPVVLYLPVRGDRITGTLYLREEGHAGSWTLRRLSFRERSSQNWTIY